MVGILVLAYGANTSEDYMNPIIADADTGHGGITATMKLAKMFIENGAAGIHIEERGRGVQIIAVNA